ncbi:hypothetical protein JCM1393_07720 [Clostridium carnis]
MLEKLSKNAKILDIKRAVVPGIISKTIRTKPRINTLQTVRIGLVKAKIKAALTISRLFIENLLISKNIYGVTQSNTINSIENIQVVIILYCDVEKNFILE